jgi:hypothetical protein
MLDETVDRPRESGSADVTLVLRGVTVTACVEVSSTDLVVVRPSVDALDSPADVAVGDPVELYWVGAAEERSLRGTVREVQEDTVPRWHLAVEGPAESSQRRKAVRARVHLPVEIPWAGALMLGTTVDVSEAGMRALMDGWGVPMDPGTTSQVTLVIDDDPLHLRGEIVWTVERGAQWLLAMKFLDVSERAGDTVRRRVFRALRDERAADAVL